MSGGRQTLNCAWHRLRAYSGKKQGGDIFEIPAHNNELMKCLWSLFWGGMEGPIQDLAGGEIV